MRKRLAATAFLCVSLVGISPRIKQSGKFRALGENMAYAQEVRKQNPEVKEDFDYCKDLLASINDAKDSPRLPPLLLILIPNAEQKILKSSKNFEDAQKKELIGLIGKIKLKDKDADASLKRMNAMLEGKAATARESVPVKEEKPEVKVAIPVKRELTNTDPMSAHVKELLAGLEDMLNGKEREHDTAEEILKNIDENAKTRIEKEKAKRTTATTKPEVIDALDKITAKLDREIQKLREGTEKTEAQQQYLKANDMLKKLEDGLNQRQKGRIITCESVTDAQVKPVIAEMKRARKIFVGLLAAQKKEEDDLKAAMKEGEEKIPNLKTELERDVKLWNNALTRINELKAAASPETARFLDEYIRQTRQRVKEVIVDGLADVEKLVSQGKYIDAEQKARYTDATGHKLGSPSNAIIIVQNIVEAETYLKQKSKMPNGTQMTPQEYFNYNATRYGATLEKLKQNERTRIYGEQYSGRIEEGKKSTIELQTVIEDTKTRLKQNVQDNTAVKGGLLAVKDNVAKLGRMPVPVEPAPKEVYSIQGLDILSEDHDRIEYGVNTGNGNVISYQKWLANQKASDKGVRIKGFYQMEIKEEGGQLFVVQPDDLQYAQGKVYAGVYVEATGEVREIQWRFDANRKRYLPVLEVERGDITKVKIGAAIGTVIYNRESHEMKPTPESAADDKFLATVCARNMISPVFNERHGTHRHAFILFQ